MRVSPLALRVFACACCLALVVLSLIVSPVALAADSNPPTAASIQVKLVEARQQLNSLYDQASAASERLNGAVYEAQLAKVEVTRNAKAVAVAEKNLGRERVSVAELTVQDLQSGTGLSNLGALFDSAGPGQLLDRSTTYSSTQEAMAARIDRFTASTVVYNSAAHRAATAAKKQGRALANQVKARTAIDSAIARAESAVKAATTERVVLLHQLANVQGIPLADVTSRQDKIDRTLDAQPGTPVAHDRVVSDPGNSPSAPSPDPKPSDPPTTAAPKPPVINAPPASSSKVETAIAFARAQLGDPYEWGASGPNSWDCSGLTMKAWAAAGVSIPHYAGAQYTSTKAVPVNDIQRGDLLFWSDGSVASIYHDALYLGGGQMIQAPRTGRNVEIVPLSYWIKPDLASRPG
ncbi:MAG: C40 family peptidase [Kineosporiaceae bacterium]|nr:C40 family peptidase [Aeromicrobium sp.]